MKNVGMKGYYGYKSDLWVLLVILMVHSNIVNSCIEQERMGLLEFRQGFRQQLESYGQADSFKYLLDWTENSQRDCCEWERVTCDNTTGHVTELALGNLIDRYDGIGIIWSINCSLFLPFWELRSLNLSYNSFGQWETNYGFERLEALKKLEILDLSLNSFDNNNIYHSLGVITSLKTLLFRENDNGGSFPTNELVGLVNLETLDLSYNGYIEFSPKRGFEKLSVFKKLKTLILGGNDFNEEAYPYLNSFTSLKVLDLQDNNIIGSFPTQELGNLANLESLDLSNNAFTEIQGLESMGKFYNLMSSDVSSKLINRSLFQSLKNLNLAFNNFTDRFPREVTDFLNLEMLDLSTNGLSSLTAKDCELLLKLKKMRHLDLRYNIFGKSVFRILGALPSLRFLSLSFNSMEGSLSNLDLTYNLSSLEVLLLDHNFLNGSLPVEGLASLRFLEVLDLKHNSFFGSIPPSIGAMSSLKVLSLAFNQLNGSLPDQGLCELVNLVELDLSNNNLEGTISPCLSNLKSLRFLDIALNNFTGNLSSSLVGNLSSLEYIDLSHNLFEGTFSFSSLANHTNLVVFQITSNGKLVVETEDMDWFPMFQLKILVLSNCNLNKLSKNKIPKFLLHQHKLMGIDLSVNNLNDLFPNWLLVNNTGLREFNVRKNSLSGPFYLPSAHNIDALDFSDNRLNGEIQSNIGNMLPFVSLVNLSNNALEGSIPSSIVEMHALGSLDLSSNNLSREVPPQLLSNQTGLYALSLSNNSLHGQIFSSHFYLTFGLLADLKFLQLGDNQFTGPLATSVFNSGLFYLDVSNNLFSGDLSKLTHGSIFSIMDTVILGNNSFIGEFPCSLVPYEFMDVSYNSFSGPISSCSNQKLQNLKHLHLQGNTFTGLIPQEFLNSSVLLTLDISDNNFSGTIPMPLAPLSDLRILLSRGNLLNGSIPSHLCWLKKISLMDLSNNFFTGSIPRCFSNITFGSVAGYDLAFEDQYPVYGTNLANLYTYEGILSYEGNTLNYVDSNTYGKKEEVSFVTKSRAYTYQGNILNYMFGLDVSNNKLTGEIPREIGDLSAVRALNLSHNQLSGPIPKSLSNLKQVESLDLSYNELMGNIPMELTNLYSLAVFSVAYNNLSGTIPYGKAQFETFNASSYEGNSGLCGPPLETSCNPNVGTKDEPSDESDGEWFGVDGVVIAAIFGASYITFLVGTLTVLSINPNWRKWWFDRIDAGLCSCYFFFVDLRKKLGG